MQTPLSWIADYVKLTLGADELAAALTMAGCETNNLGSGVPDVAGVITARIEKIDRHPDADKLTVCQVRPADDAPPLTVVCGAPNIKEGQIVPLAQIGTVLPDGTKLKRSKLRGVASEGMMCSERELGISEDHSGIWILPEGTPLGLALPQALGADDAVLEPEPTPNRGDLMSVYNLAREIGAITGQAVTPPAFTITDNGPPIEGAARVDIDDYDGCPRYVARLIRNVKIGPSPDWMVKRLEASGMRSINNVVDVTNYVMLELGQPLHAFDFNRLAEKRIVVKRAQAGDKFTTLDGQERTLRDDTLLICDGAGPVAIAGVMGGLDSEVSDQTTDVLLESACFKPTSIRRTARLLGVPTEASRRFDKGVDPLGTLLAADRAASLMAELAGGQVAQGVIDAHEKLAEPKRIELRPERVNQILGLELSANEQSGLLETLDGVKVEPGKVLSVTAPTYRPDLVIEEDLIEEIARLHGYNHIPATMPRFQMTPMKRSRKLAFAGKVRERLAALGFSEVVQTNFEDPKRLGLLGLGKGDPRLNPVKLMNPLSENESILRTTLVPKLLSGLALNRQRGETGAVRLYELSAVFEAAEGGGAQRESLTGLVSGSLDKELWDLECPAGGFYALKQVVEQLLGISRFPGARLERDPSPAPYFHPGKCSRLVMGKNFAGSFGEVHPRVAEAFELKGEIYLFELQFDLLTEYADYVPKARSISKFPANLRDIAVVVDETVAMEDIIKAANKLKSPLLESMTVFDVFRGGSVPAGKKSLAFHVSYQAMDRTLTDEDVSREHARLAEQLQREAGAVLR